MFEAESEGLKDIYQIGPSTFDKLLNADDETP